MNGVCHGQIVHYDSIMYHNSINMFNVPVNSKSINYQGLLNICFLMKIYIVSHV